MGPAIAEDRRHVMMKDTGMKSLFILLGLLPISCPHTHAHCRASGGFVIYLVTLFVKTMIHDS